MIRVDAKKWTKTGIEYVEGAQNVGTIVAREVSDSSVGPRQDSPPAGWLTLLSKSGYVEIQCSFNNWDFKVLQLAYFPGMPG